MSETIIKIQPITLVQQKQVIEETDRFIQSAAEYYNSTMESIPVLFDLSGRAAGMYRIKARQRVIRYNPFIFSKYFDDNFTETIPHEVAHYVTDSLYGLRKIRPHGIEWKAVMQVFGVEAKRCADYNLSGIPKRQHKTFSYYCSCQEYQLTSRRHNKINNGSGRYLCRSCGEKLLFVENNIAID